MTNNRKRKSLVGRALEELEPSETNEDAPTQARAPTSMARPRKAPRPSVEIVEINSDGDERGEQPRFTGALRGLHPKNMIPTTQLSVETEHEDGANSVENTQSVRHVTRQSRYGKSEANYDMKYHPMDEVTRPKRAAQRRSASALPDNDVETDEESLPTSARLSDASSESNESSGKELESVPRLPDPRATRHSGRTATQKAVDYSSKHHPQDFALPGFQHKAKARKRLLKGAKRSVFTTPKPAEVPRGTVDLTNEATDDKNVTKQTKQTKQTEEEEPTAAEMARGTEPKKHSPRKKLRSLADSRTRGTVKKVNLKKSGIETGSDVVNLLGSMNDPSKKGLASSEADLYHLLTEKIEKYKATQRLAEETDEDPADDLQKLEDLHSSQNHNTRQYDDDDAFMFMDHGHLSDDDTGGADPANYKQKSATMRDTEIDDARHTPNSFPAAGRTRKDNQQSQELPPPSQFDEQIAVTEIWPKAADGGRTGDPMSGLEAYLRGDTLHDGNHSRQSLMSDGHDSLSTTGRPNLVPEGDIESSNKNEPSSGADKDRYNTPNTSHGGSNQASRQHSRSKGEETTAEQLLNHPARADSTSEVEKRTSKPESTEMQQPRDVDDDLLRHFHSSQRTRSDIMMESDPTTVGSEL